MADFLSSGWGVFIAVTVIVSIIACALLAWIMAAGRTPVLDNGEVESTGHIWDEDLQELNNPLPRWWLYLFYITCLFGAIYLVLYPGLGAFRGTLGWSSHGQYQQEILTASAQYDPLYEQYIATDIAELSAQPEVVAMGERLFLTYCSQCHGSDARGSRSFPNLADNDWLGAGDGKYIKNTILNGRVANMPAMAAAIGGTEDDVTAVAHYVLSLSDSDHEAELAAAGKTRYVVCGGCHGMDGKGNAILGSPNLTDDIWLYGGSIESIKSAVQKGLNNQMPQFGTLLGEGKSHVLAAYVYSLSSTDEDGLD